MPSSCHSTTSGVQAVRRNAQRRIFADHNILNKLGVFEAIAHAGVPVALAGDATLAVLKQAATELARQVQRVVDKAQRASPCSTFRRSPIRPSARRRRQRCDEKTRRKVSRRRDLNAELPHRRLEKKASLLSIALHGSFRELQCFGDFLFSVAAEIAHFDHLSQARFSLLDL